MKIEVAKSDLENALAIPRIAVGSGEDLSAHYLFRVRGEGVEILAQDLRVFGSASISGCQHDGEEGDAFTVESWRLDKWLSGVSGNKSLTLESREGGEIVATGSRSKTRFRSLDPTKFPFWDDLYSNATDVGEISPVSLARALNCSRWFVSADDTAKPELCQVEAVEGVLWATDRRALASVEMPRLPDLAVRIPGKDVSALIRFLTDKVTQGSNITIKQAERAFEEGGGAFAVFHRPDGAYLGVTRPTSSFPTLNVDREAEDEVSLKIDKDEFTSAIEVLLSGAPKNHKSITFSYDQESKAVRLSMPCEAGDVVDYLLEQASVENGEKWETDFTIDFQYVKGIADTFKLQTLDLGVNKRGRGGYVSFRYSDEEDDGKGNRYYSVIVWRT